MNKKNYLKFYNSLLVQDRKLLDDFFISLKNRISLSPSQNKLLIMDFENAFVKYNELNYSLSESIKLLNIKNLGNFYKGDTKRWYPLDYAAKIYPLSLKTNRMAIFRISMYLKEDVIPEILQMALLFTIKRFPYFSTTVRKGFFWHYMDSIKKRHHIKKEKDFVCSSINISSTFKSSFRVLYFNNRISLEVFHILSDGSGATIFLKTLVAEYLRLLNIDIPFEEDIFDINKKPVEEEWSNDFIKAEKKGKSSGFKDSNAIQLDGKLSDVRPCQILHFDFNSEEFRYLAKNKNVSVTVLMLAFIFKACSYSVSSNKDIKIQVPVNMRKYYDSKTLRNFSLYAVIIINKSKINDFDELLKEINSQLLEKTKKEKLNETMYMTNKLVNSLRFIPLNIKRPIAKMVYGFLGDKVFTSVLSNVGVINLPKEMINHVEKMDVVLGTSNTNRALFSLVTCNGIMTLSISKLTLNSSIENNLYSLFNQYNLNAKVYGSDVYADRK